MKIILDFDDTILNTGGLMKELIDVFKKVGFSENDYYLSYQKSKESKGDFDLGFILDLLYKIKVFDKEKTKNEVKEVFIGTKRFVYPDFFDFIKDFKKSDLILLSTGEKNFQGGKIKESLIIPFFSELIIIPKNKSAEIEKICMKYSDEKIFFVEDKAKEIDEVKKITSQVVTMKMERPTGRHVFPKSELADYIVKNLNEAKKIINSLS